MRTENLDHLENCLNKWVKCKVKERERETGNKTLDWYHVERMVRYAFPLYLESDAIAWMVLEDTRLLSALPVVADAEDAVEVVSRDFMGATEDEKEEAKNLLLALEQEPNDFRFFIKASR